MRNKSIFCTVIVFLGLWSIEACKSTQPSQQAKPDSQSSPATASENASPAQAAVAPAATPPSAQAPEAPPTPPKPTVVPAGTVLGVRMVTPVSSKESHEGDPFSATLTNSVRVQGSVLIPAGTTVSGVVSQAHSAGKFKGAASLSLTPRSISLQGTRYPIHATGYSETTTGKGKRTAGMVGGGAGAGALIGGIAGGGKGALIGGAVGAGAGTAGAAFTGNNRDISLPAETPLHFKLTSSLHLDQQAASESAQ